MDDGWSTWTPATYKGDQDGVLGSWLYVGHNLAVVGIWEPIWEVN